MVIGFPFNDTASQIIWAVGSSYQGIILIVLKSGLNMTSISVGLYTSGGSPSSSSVAYPPEIVWIKIDWGKRWLSSLRPLINLFVGSIFPLAIPPKSGTKHSTSVI